MSHAVRILATDPVATGFAVAGLSSASASDVPSAILYLAEQMRRPDAGVILLENRLYDALPDDFRAQLARRPLPMVVPFPGPTWQPALEAAEAYVVELLRRAIGYRVKLR